MTGSHENNCYHVGQMRLEVRKKSWLSTCSSYLNYRNIKASDVLSDNPKTTSESKINSFYFMFVLQSWSLSPGPCTHLASIQLLGHISSTHSRFIDLFQHLRVARCFQSSHFSFVCSFFFSTEMSQKILFGSSCSITYSECEPDNEAVWALGRRAAGGRTAAAQEDMGGLLRGSTGIEDQRDHARHGL